MSKAEKILSNYVLKSEYGLPIWTESAVLLAMKEAMEVAFEAGYLKRDCEVNTSKDECSFKDLMDDETTPDKQTFISEFFGEEK